jgi:hypothetical protein
MATGPATGIGTPVGSIEPVGNDAILFVKLAKSFDLRKVL